MAKTDENLVAGRTCPDCGGKGYVFQSDGPANDDYEFHQQQCRRCLGTGIESYEPYQTQRTKNNPSLFNLLSV